MAKRAFQALAVVMAVSLVALISFTAGAAGASTSGSVDGDSGKSDGSFLHQLHSMALQWHHDGGGHGQHGGGGGFGDHAGELVNQLNLSQEQTERLEAIHRSFASIGSTVHGSMADLHEMWVEQFKRGDIEADAARRIIDQQLDEIRTVAYSVTDDLLALVNSLDAGQREIVLAHLQEGHAGHVGLGH